MLILHPEGVWLKNTAMFPLHDPETAVTFPPQTLVKAKRSVWSKGQPTIVEADDPLAPPKKTAAKIEANIPPPSK